MKDFYFTFGHGQPHFPSYVKVTAEDELTARQLMVGKYGQRWSMCYDNYNDIDRCDQHELEHIKQGSDNTGIYAFLEAFDDDSLSDGAWMAMLQEGVRAWNEQNGTDLDEHDTWLEYVQHKSTCST